MTRHTFPHIRWAWLITIASAVGLVLPLSRCEQNPIIADLPGNQWVFSDTFFTLVDTNLVRTPAHGSSHTLYAGQVDEQNGESGILIRFKLDSVDTAELSGLQADTLFLFRRVFANELPEPDGADFALYVINVDGPDTVWTESDTGLTLADFTDTTLHATAPMMEDTVTVFVDGVASDVVMKHLAFPVDTLLLRQWANGSMPNNGFLIRQENQGTLVSFYSRNSSNYRPYLALTSADTTMYRLPAEDLSIYRSNQDISVYSDASLHLDYSSGISSHIDFGPDFEIDTTGIISGVRIVLYVNGNDSQINADRVDFRILVRAEPVEEGDSTVGFFRAAYLRGDDSFIFVGSSDPNELQLRDILIGYAKEPNTNHGLDLVVSPYNHDFDHLAFWGSEADAEHKPRLEVTYSRLYKEVP